MRGVPRSGLIAPGRDKYESGLRHRPTNLEQCKLADPGICAERSLAEQSAVGAPARQPDDSFRTPAGIIYQAGHDNWLLTKRLPQGADQALPGLGGFINEYERSA